MASTSASAVQKSFKYDVLLSFRGEDTRKGFVDHLYQALQLKGFNTYKDEEKIQKGERISEQLIKSIEDSRFYVIVFSQNYASSSWCLDELMKIMECEKMAEHTAYPVFYDVEPTEVRHQSGPVGEAFAKHVKDGLNGSAFSFTGLAHCLPLDRLCFVAASFFNGSSFSFTGSIKDLESEDDVGRWRDALKEAACLAGWELKNTLDGHEAKFIQQIVQEISLRLHFVNSSTVPKLVGMETRLKNVVSSLETGSDDVRMIGIKGIGGGGKTTLARAVFDLMSVWFEGKSFVENVREVSKGPGLEKLQKQVLKDVLNDQSVDVTSVSDGKYKLERRMRSVKALVVLDDVDDIDQLEALAGELTWFKPGSRIIITTRDQQVLVAHGVSIINDVNLLSDEEAFCLFSRHAFKKEIPNPGYEELSRKVIDYAAGLPLTLKVLGSHLCGRTEPEWVDAIERLKTIPLEKTLTRLEISYDGLENDHKEIFLDVACLLKGMKKKIAIRVLESRGFHAEIGLRVLEQKSLLTVSDVECVQMHDHLEEMGKNIIRRSHPGEPNKHNRLWITEEIDNILAMDLGTNGTTSMKLHNFESPLDIIMKGLRKMEELRVLCVYSNNLIDMPNPIDQYLPNTLQSLYWVGYPFTCLPKTFHANKLVHLEISSGNITQLWEGGEKKVLSKLKFLVLKYLDIRSFNMGMTPNLQIFCLKGCMKFVEFRIPVACPKLKFLQLKSSNVGNINIGSAPCLETLEIEYCKDMIELHMPSECPKLKYLMIRYSKVSSVKIGSAPCFEQLKILHCKDLVQLHMRVECPKLKYLELYDSKVSSLNIGPAPCLESLAITFCKDMVALHMPSECPKLKSFILRGTKLSSLKIGSAPCLEYFEIIYSRDVGLHMPVECPNLKFLKLRSCNVRSLNLESASCLETLNLATCYNLQELRMPIESPKLKLLKLCDSKVSILNIRQAPCLEKLYIKNCIDLVELHMPVECPKLKFLKVCGSKVSTLNIGSAPCLEVLNLANSNNLVEFHILVELPKLKFLNLSCSKVSNVNLELTPHLERLDLKNCYFLQTIHESVGCLKKFVYLDLSGCSKIEYFCARGYKLTSHHSVATMLNLTAESLDTCQLHPDSKLPKFRFKCLYDGNLEELLSFGLCSCLNLEYFSASICDLQRLRVLTLEGSIPEVPKDLYMLESLEHLTLSMKDIKHIPDSICMMKHLKSLKLRYCLLLEQLPSDLGRLEGLEELRLTDCISLRDIPSSICNMKSLKYLDLYFCILVEKLPEEFGRLESLELINMEGAGIRRLPQSIFELKGLYIIGSTWRLESYGFTTFRQISTYAASYNIRNSQHESPF